MCFSLKTNALCVFLDISTKEHNYKIKFMCLMCFCLKTSAPEFKSEAYIADIFA